jgi:hypothetical protein
MTEGLPVVVARYLEERGLVAVPKPPNTHQHVGVWTGNGQTCVLCGTFLGVPAVVLPDIDWDEFERVRATAESALAHLPDLPGIHMATLRDAVAQQVAFAIIEGRG